MAAKQNEQGRMISEVLTHTRQIVDQANAQAPKVVRWTYARQHQKLGRGDGPTAQDDLFTLDGDHLATALYLYSHSAPVLEKDTAGGGEAV